MKKKDFDCVEMKRKAAEETNRLLAQMTVEEQIEFWKKRSKELKLWRDSLLKEAASKK